MGLARVLQMKISNEKETAEGKGIAGRLNLESGRPYVTAS